MGFFSKIAEKLKFKKKDPRLNGDVQLTEEDEKGEVFRLLTPKLLQEFEKEREELKKRIKEAESKQIVMVERIVDGQVIYETESAENEEDDEFMFDDYDGRDEQLIEGNPVPLKLGLIPQQMYQRPLIEIDKFIHKKEDSFVVISKRFKKPQIYRFSSTKSLFLMTPFNKLRRALIWFTTWQFFDWFMILTILVNLIVLAVPLTDTQNNITEYVFNSIYTIEAICKILARGFILKPYTYIRDPWNIIDFGILIISYITIIINAVSTGSSTNLSALRAFRVLRVLKTVNIITGLKIVVSSILRALPMFMQVIGIMALLCAVLSLFTLQAFSGRFSQKCVLTYNSSNTNNIGYKEWITDESNWYLDTYGSDVWFPCSNGSTSNEGRTCPTGYTCLQGIGQNPRSGTKNYDNFGFSMMLTFQVFCLDYWDDVYLTVLDTAGLWNMVFYVFVVFAGAFYLVNLTFPVVAQAYYTEVKIAAMKQEAADKDLVFDIKTLKAKMAQRQKELEEYEKLHPKNPNKAHESDDEGEKITEGIAPQMTDGQFKDDSDTANIADIKLSENLGGFNTVIEEGGPTSHFFGRDLVADDRSWRLCLKLGSIHLKYNKLQNVFLKIVENIYFELFIAFCIVLNTIVMAVQYDGQPQSVDDLQSYTNYVVFGVFVLEAIFKIIAYGRLYFLDPVNLFDLAIIALSIVDFAVPNLNGLTVFRAFRLLRIFKLAKTWKTMSKILKIIGSTIPAISFIILVLGILMFIFAVLGNGLFESAYNNYYTSSTMPYWNFVDVPHSILMMFRVFNGERVQPEKECWMASGPLCTVVFYPITIFGNFLILNMILAVLLAAFDSDNLKKFDKDDKDERIEKEIQRFKRFFNKFCSCCVCLCCERFNLCKKNVAVTPVNEDPKKEELIEREEPNAFLNKDKIKEIEEERRRKKLFEQKENMKAIQEKNTVKKPKNILHKCFPLFLYKYVFKFATEDNKLHQYWTKFRKIILRIIEHNLFEGFILLIIFLSSLSLTFQDVNLKSGSYEENILNIFDYIFTSIFVIEMILKWFGNGLKKYFTDAWSLLDFVIVIVSVISSSFTASNSSTNIGFLRVLRTLRALRPLRAISRFSTIKTVVNSLVYSIPAIFNVFIVCMIFWLIFSIIGVTLFKGKFYKCVYTATGIKVSNALVSTKDGCLAMSGTTWYNSRINFDNVAAGFLALFQVATFQGWMEIMEDAVDTTDVGQQPITRSSEWVYIFFIAFILIGSQFILKLIIAVIIDNFNLLKKQFSVGVIDIFLTPSQLKYLQSMNQIGSLPGKAVKRPNNKVQGFVFDMVSSPKFEISITIVIALNMIVNAVEFYNQSNDYGNITSVVNTIFVTIYGLESVLKLIGLRLHFFRNPWNIFDLFINILSIIYAPLKCYMSQVMVQPNLLRLTRLFRVSQPLRPFEFAKGIRKLLYTLIISIPASFSIGILLVLIMFIYSIIGMNLFLNVKLANGLTETVCFQTFGKSMITMFRIATGAGWNELLEGLSISNSDPGMSCTDGFDVQSMPPSFNTANVDGCGSFGLGIAFLVTFVILTRVILLNLFIAVLLENYELANSLEENNITQDDFDMFYTTWEKYDPYATQFIKLDQLSNFVAELDAPFGVPKPNDKAIALFNVPIIKGEMVHILDVLHAVAKYATGDIEEDGEFDDMQMRLDLQFLKYYPMRADYAPITSTMQRKKQDIAVRKLQKALKKWLIKKRLQK